METRSLFDVHPRSAGKRTTIRYVTRTGTDEERFRMVSSGGTASPARGERELAADVCGSIPVVGTGRGTIWRGEYVSFREIRRRGRKRWGDRDGGSERERKKGTFVMGLDWNVCIQNVSLLRASFTTFLSLAHSPPPQTSPFSLLLFCRTRWPCMSSKGLTPRGAYATNVF